MSDHISEAKLAKELDRFAPALQEIAQQQRTSGLARLKLGKLYYEITRSTIITYEALDTFMLEKHAVQIPRKSTLANLRHVYNVWHMQARVPLDELAPFSDSLLRAVASRTTISRKTAEMWLQRMRTYTRDQVLATAAGLVDDPSEAPGRQFTNIVLPATIATVMTDARVYFAEAVGVDTLSNGAFVEFMGKLILDTSRPNLRTLWAKMHGEEIDE